MLFKPSVFRAPREHSVSDLILSHPFADMITHHEGELEISHLPFLYEADEGELGTLYVHLAKANTHWRSLDAGALCTIVFHGPSSYISGSWYGPESSDHIPTWNYAVVHCEGRAERLDDPKKVFWQMDQIHRRYDKGPLVYVSEKEKKEMIPEVVLFRIPVKRCDSVFKLNQNRSVDDASRVMRALNESPDTGKKELSQLMRSSLETRNDS